MKTLILALCGLSCLGCSVRVVDERLTRNEVAEAFKQRDTALENLAKAVIALQKRNEVTKNEKAN